MENPVEDDLLIFSKKCFDVLLLLECHLDTKLSETPKLYRFKLKLRKKSPLLF